MRKKIIAGNWKMNMTAKEAEKFLKNIKSKVQNAKAEVVFCVPYLAIDASLRAVAGTDICIGAQNMHYLDNGAYTGEISAPMLQEAGVDYVIIGHSERRMYNNETDESVNKKIIKALETNIKPIFCVGESLQEREGNTTKEVIASQINKGLTNIEKEKVVDVTIAYEPIWAIGTGKTATDEQANEVCAFIREILKEKYDDAAERISILYGGSVNEKNIGGLMHMSDIDGALVGGASLKETFAEIVHYE